MAVNTKTPVMRQMIVPFSLKAAVDPASHTFEGLAAVIGVKDLGNDIIEPGAFTKTLGDWKKSGDAIPLLNSHNQYDVFAALGQLIAAKETPDGLWTKWELLDGPDADRVMARLTPSKTTNRAIIGKMSIGYIPVKWEEEQPEGTTSYWDKIRHLTEVTLKEVSLVLFPMAPGAAIDASSVKSFLISAQATDAKSIDAVTTLQLRKLQTRIGTMLAKAAEQEVEDKGKAKKPKPASADDEMENQPVGTSPTPNADPEKPKAKADPEHPGSSDDDDDDLDVVADLTKESDEATMALCPGCGTEMEDGKCMNEKCSMYGKASAVDQEIKDAQTYEMQEALQQRLKKLMLKNKVSNLTK